MFDLKIFIPEISSSVPLIYAHEGIQAGFPSPAQDYTSETIDLNKDLIAHPTSTFYGRVVGDSMADEGITQDDILVIDKSVEPEDGDLAVCCLDGEFTLKPIHIMRDGRVFLVPSNKMYRTIEVTPENEFMVWGIVMYTIKPNRRRMRL